MRNSTYFSKCCSLNVQSAIYLRIIVGAYKICKQLKQATFLSQNLHITIGDNINHDINHAMKINAYAVR